MWLEVGFHSRDWNRMTQMWINDVAQSSMEIGWSGWKCEWICWLGIGRRELKWEWIRWMEMEWNQREMGMDRNWTKVAGNRLE
jgi:hypothetical protein